MANTGSVKVDAVSKFTYAFMAVLMLNTVVPARTLAADSDLENTNTGAYSSNSNEVNENQTVAVSTNNEANVTNNYNFNLNTGNNNVEKNTSVEEISTGSIKLALSTMTNANTGTSGTSLLEAIIPSAAESNASNSNTGADSYNTNSINQDKNIRVTENNTANITNDIQVDANTGKNSVEKNTYVGKISTGDIFLAINVKNNVNEKGGRGGNKVCDSDKVCDNPTPQSSPTPDVTPTPREISELPKGGAGITPALPVGGAMIIPAGANLINIMISLLFSLAIAATSLALNRSKRA